MPLFIAKVHEQCMYTPKTESYLWYLLGERFLFLLSFLTECKYRSPEKKKKVVFLGVKYILLTQKVFFTGAGGGGDK